MSTNFKYEDTSVVVEEVNSSEIPENELIQFKTTEPIHVSELLKQNFCNTNIEEEEILITRFVNGESSFPEFYTNEDDDEELQNMETEEKVENLMSSFEAELFQSRRDAMKGNLRGSQQKDNKKLFRRKPVLSSHLQGLMGEANLHFARGQNEMAEKICLEIIRQNPLASEPFLTLAQIYETKDSEKFLQFATIAAHLEKTDRDQWIRIAEMYVERNNMQQARSCYSKGIKYNPKDFDLRLRRGQLLESINDERSAMYCYYGMLSVIPADYGEFCLKTAKKVATYFHNNGKKLQALDAMRTAYNLVPKLFKTEDINLYLELLIMNENYAPVLSTLRDNADLKIELEQDGDNIIILTCIIPDDMIPEFRAKLCVSLVHLKAVHLFDYFIANVLEFIPIEDNGIDMYMDIVEALMKEEKFSDALKLLTPLAEDPKTHSPPYVWLRHADCHRALNQIDLAITSYCNVVELAPNCFDARVTLSALLKQQGRYSDAIRALEQDVETESLDTRLLYERCLMLKDVGDLNEYINLGYLRLLRHSLKLRSREEMLLVLKVKLNYRRNYLHSVRQSRMEDPDDDRPDFLPSEEILDVEGEYQLLLDLLKTAYNLKRFGMLQKIAFTALISTIFRPKIKEIEKFVIFACIYNNDPQCAFNTFRDILAKDPRHNAYWNVYNMIIQLGDEMRYRRFITRLLHRVGNRPQILILTANYYLSSQSYKYALSGYVSIFKMTNDPLVALLLSVAFLQLTIQKNCIKRPTVATHAMAFLRKYSDLRACDETRKETFYNLGRLYHQLCIYHLAVYYYEQVLHLPDCELTLQHSDYLDLSREAAFNLHLIYKASGNYEMARKYLYEYIVV